MKQLLYSVGVCPICTARFRVEDGTICHACIDQLTRLPGPFERAVVVGEHTIPVFFATEYRGIAKKAIESVKIDGNRETARILGKILITQLVSYAEERLQADRERSIDPCIVFVPVPASVKGRHQRGFDQTEMMVRHLDGTTRNLLRRHRGREQKRLNKTDRTDNAARQYHLGPIQDRDRLLKPILLVDDVYTTGATVETCADLLIAQGIIPSSVLICTGVC